MHITANVGVINPPAKLWRSVQARIQHEEVFRCLDRDWWVWWLQLINVNRIRGGGRYGRVMVFLYLCTLSKDKTRAHWFHPPPEQRARDSHPPIAGNLWTQSELVTEGSGCGESKKHKASFVSSTEQYKLVTPFNHLLLKRPSDKIRSAWKWYGQIK